MLSFLSAPSITNHTQSKAQPAPPREEAEARFDTLILSDLLFNHSEHAKLVHSVKALLRKPTSPNHCRQPSSFTPPSPSPRALVFFTPHRPWLLEKDLAFFDLARSEGLVVRKVLEEVCEKPMFEDDRGDERLRRTVMGFEVLWPEVVGGIGKGEG